MKIIATIHNGPHFVRVYRNAEFGEWIARLDGDKRTDYFTNDKQDALDTAQAMVNLAVANDLKRALRADKIAWKNAKPDDDNIVSSKID